MDNDVIELFHSNRELGKQLLDSLPTVIDVTDAEGRLSQYISAAGEFSGRIPEWGSDQWSVTWKLCHPNGTPMPDEECPMAISWKENCSLNAVEAIDERTDGEHRWLKALPSPWRNNNSYIIGGINMLIDITEQKRVD